MALESSQTGRLEEARFLAIVRDRFGVDLAGSEQIRRLPFGVAATADERGWAVSTRADPAVLGGVLLWATRSPATQFDAVFAHHAGVHARRLATLAPEFAVWRLDGAEVIEAPVAPLSPPQSTSRLESLEQVIEGAGATVRYESGILRAEVRGLEVGRAVEGEAGPVLESGVGRFDREAGAMLHAHRTAEEALAAVVAQVAPHRMPGVPSHPAGRLARARWLRSLVLETPSLAGLDQAAAVDPIMARGSLLDDVAATMVGSVGDRAVVAICAVGVDLGVVPELADQVLRHQPDEVRVVLAPRDRVPALVELCTRLPIPVSFVEIDTPWSADQK